MYKVIFCISILFIFSCSPDSKVDKKETKKATPTIDLGVFTGQNYDSELMQLNLPANWQFELKSVSESRQIQLTRDQIKENILPLNEVKDVTLFVAKENITTPEAIEANPIPGSILCIAVNLKKQDAADINQYVERFRSSIASRTKQTKIVEFNLSPTKDEMFNNIKFKVIDSETKYPTIEGAEDIVVRGKTLFHKKGNLVYTYSLSYSNSKQLEEIIPIVSSIIYKK